MHSWLCHHLTSFSHQLPPTYHYLISSSHPTSSFPIFSHLPLPLPHPPIRSPPLPPSLPPSLTHSHFTGLPRPNTQWRRLDACEQHHPSWHQATKYSREPRRTEDKDSGFWPLQTDRVQRCSLYAGQSGSKSVENDYCSFFEEWGSTILFIVLCTYIHTPLSRSVCMCIVCAQCGTLCVVLTQCYCYCCITASSQCTGSHALHGQSLQVWATCTCM